MLSFILYLCLKLLKHKEMTYDFSISGSTLVVTLDTESGKFSENIDDNLYNTPIEIRVYN